MAVHGETCFTTSVAGLPVVQYLVLSLMCCFFSSWDFDMIRSSLSPSLSNYLEPIIVSWWYLKILKVDFWSHGWNCLEIILWWKARVFLHWIRLEWRSSCRIWEPQYFRIAGGGKDCDSELLFYIWLLVISAVKLRQINSLFYKRLAQWVRVVKGSPVIRDSAPQPSQTERSVLISNSSYDQWLSWKWSFSYFSSLFSFIYF
jgi:hypothetical protein